MRAYALIGWLGAGFFGVLPVAAGPLPATGSVEALFTPWDDAEGAVLGVIAGARQAIYVQAYLLTSRNLANGLLAARQRGVQVEVLADAEMTEKGESSLIPYLAAAGVPVRLETRYSAAHNKVLLADPEGPHPAVVTGSYNFTWAAQARNAENVLILRDQPALAGRYLANWRRHQGEAVPFEGALRTGGGLSCTVLSREDARLFRSVGECNRRGR